MRPAKYHFCFYFFFLMLKIFVMVMLFLPQGEWIAQTSALVDVSAAMTNRDHQRTTSTWPRISYTTR